MRVKIKILGCGDAFGTGGNHPTSFFIHGGEEGILLDCGAGTLVRLQQEKISLRDIQKIIITHFHGDHYGGIPFLIIANQFTENGNIPWEIIGPPGLKTQLFHLQEAMYPGTGSLLDSLPIHFHEYTKDSLLSIGSMSIEAMEVKHSPASHPHAVRIMYNGISIFYTGDTEWLESFVSLITKSDLSIVECFSNKSQIPGHISFQDLDKYLNNSKKQIYLTHLGPEMSELGVSPFIKLKDGVEINYEKDRNM